MKESVESEGRETRRRTLSDPFKASLLSLLSEWCGALLRCQIHRSDDPGAHGGLLCPDCGFVHGRCGDALYPFLRMARDTGDRKWVEAALAVQKWSDVVSNDDGSFRNEDRVNSWDGVTVFGALALGEALHFHGDLLPPDERARWAKRLESAARWIEGVDWADHGTINYPISAAAALASASRALDDRKLLAAARHWAAWARDYFRPDGILIGEGARTPTPRGVYAVDVPYNLEESLPNLALYAEIAGDEAARALALRSFASHLDFLLPDGSYDAGWCSRSFKWTLWGSRTSDGIAGLLPWARSDGRIAEAVRRNVEYLRACTHDGLLHGGPHLKAQGRAPCLHHTFSHAKALAAALDGGCFPDKRLPLPGDLPRGVTRRDPLGTTFVALGKWRASFTVSDVYYGAPGSHATGGAMTMLWHEAAGPLCVSSMSDYARIEGSNMAKPCSDRETSVLTPRLERGGFLSCLDGGATLEVGEDRVRAAGRLTDLAGKAGDAFSLETRFDGDSVHFRATGAGATFVLPVVSEGREAVDLGPRRVEIRKARARVTVESDAVIRGDAARVFHFVPGVQAVRLAIDVPPGGVSVSLTVREKA